MTAVVARMPRHHLTLADLYGIVERLEKEITDLQQTAEERERLFAKLRSCLARDCLLCPECVVALYLDAEPSPLTLPQKYVDHKHRLNGRCPSCLRGKETA